MAKQVLVPLDPIHVAMDDAPWIFLELPERWVMTFQRCAIVSYSGRKRREAARKLSAEEGTAEGSVYSALRLRAEEIVNTGCLLNDKGHRLSAVLRHVKELWAATELEPLTC